MKQRIIVLIILSFLIVKVKKQKIINFINQTKLYTKFVGFLNRFYVATAKFMAPRTKFEVKC